MATPRELPESTSPASERLIALDAFRGLTVAGMILVNNPGTGSAVYSPLKHAEWHGFTPTDLVFPSFLFIAGVAIPLALGKRLDRGEAAGSLLPRVIRRGLIIVALGLFLNAFPIVGRDWSTLRFPGVLQRIGVCYLVAASIYLFTNGRTRLFLVALLLLGYWALLTLVPVPGVGAGDLSRPNNLAAWLDRLWMPGHLYKPDYDPEGVLSTLPAIATTLIGVLTGDWLRGGAGKRSAAESVSGLFGAGLVLWVVGAIWGDVFPINKALWTSTFVLHAAGLSLLWFAFCGWLIEVRGLRGWTWPFVAFGSNPILAFVGSGLVARLLTMIQVNAGDGQTTTLRAAIYNQGFAPWFQPTLASFLFAFSYVLFWFLIVAILYRLKVFIRV